MWQQLFIAFCLVLVIEGMFPCLAPGKWRETIFTVASLNDRQLRTIGLVSMLSGVGLLYLFN